MGVETVFGEHTEPDPDKALALAVIHRAILDLVAPDSQVTWKEQRDAELFLFAKDGAWAASRRAWCEVADIEEAWLRVRVRAILDGEASIDAGQSRRGAQRRRGANHQWDEDNVLGFLRANGHMPWPLSSKAPLVRILNDAGFKAPRGGPVTADTVTTLMQRRREAFATGAIEAS